MTCTYNNPILPEIFEPSIGNCSRGPSKSKFRIAKLNSVEDYQLSYQIVVKPTYCSGYGFNCYTRFYCKNFLIELLCAKPTNRIIEISTKLHHIAIFAQPHPLAINYNLGTNGKFNMKSNYINPKLHPPCFVLYEKLLEQISRLVISAHNSLNNRICSYFHEVRSTHGSELRQRSIGRWKLPATTRICKFYVGRVANYQLQGIVVSSQYSSNGSIARRHYLFCKTGVAAGTND